LTVLLASSQNSACSSSTFSGYFSEDPSLGRNRRQVRARRVVSGFQTPGANRLYFGAQLPRNRGLASKPPAVRYYIAPVAEFSKSAVCGARDRRVGERVGDASPPFIGCCSMPSTWVGVWIPTMSRIFDRCRHRRELRTRPPLSLIRCGQRTTIGCECPECEGYLLAPRNGVVAGPRQAEE